MEKGFFKVFNPANNSKRLKIPTAFTDYKNGKLPNKVSLRDRFGNMWPIGVAKTGRDFYFDYGWEKFIEENTLEFGDFLIFDYDGKGVFDFKLLGKTCCEKKGSGGLKLAVKEREEEEMNIKHQKREEPKGKQPSDTNSSEESDEDDEDYMVEEEEEDEECDVAEEEDGENEEEQNERATKICKKKKPHSKGRSVEEEEEDDDDKGEYKEVKEEQKEEEEEEEEEEKTQKEPRSKHKHVEEEKDTEKAPHSRRKFVEEEDDEDEEEENQRASIFKKKVPRSKRRFAEKEDDDEEQERDEETEEEEEENERASTFKKKVPCSKGCKRATVGKVREYHDQYGTDIFRSGRATQPKNPYFVAKVRAKRRDQLYVPIDVVRDYKLELPSRMTICDSSGREFETKLKFWKDGRLWLHGGWRNLCRWNLVGKNDRCICEFVRGKGEKGLYLQVRVLYEGASSHASKKNKK